MRILVCGDRNWTDYELIVQTLQGLGRGPHRIIDGMARGADSMGHRAAMILWPREAHMRFAAQWQNYGRGAGPIRNLKMLKEGLPELVLAFHDAIERSKGTAHMLKIAREAEVPVRLVTHG